MKLALAFLCLFISQFTLAQDIQDLIDELYPRAQISNAQLDLLREEMKVHSMLIEGIERINIVGGQIQNLNAATDTVHDLLIQAIGAKSKSFPAKIRDKILHLLQEGTSKENIKKALRTLQEFAKRDIDSTMVKSISERAYLSAVRSKVATALRGRMVWGTSLARKFGISAGIFYLAAVQIDYTLPMVLIASGRPELGIPLLALPFSSTSTGSFIAIKNAIKFRKVMKALGGTKVVLDDFKLGQKLRSFFNKTLIGHTNLIDITFEGRHLVFSVQEQRLLAKTLSKLGWNKKLNYTNLLEFLESESFRPEMINRISTSSAPEEVKILQILREIEKSADEDIVNKLKSRFQGMVNEVSYLPNLSVQRTWVLKAANSSSLSELFIHMQRIPDGIPPKAFDQLWRNYILSQASMKIGPFMSKKTYDAFRQMYESYDETIRSELFHSLDYSMSSDLKSKFNDYLYKALINAGACEMQFLKLQNYPPTY